MDNRTEAMTLAERNDFLRRHLTGPCCVLTAAVAAQSDREQILAAVREFSAFNRDNDPHGEHDFARFEVNGQAYFFKWDYYDKNFERHPGDGEERTHVLTIGRANDY